METLDFRSNLDDPENWFNSCIDAFTQRILAEEELRRQERASNAFLSKPRVVRGRLATERDAMLDRLAENA